MEHSLRSNSSPTLPLAPSPQFPSLLQVQVAAGLEQRGSAKERAPKSTNYIRSDYQLLGSQWNRAALAVLASWIQACFFMPLMQVRLSFPCPPWCVKGLSQ